MPACLKVSFLAEASDGPAFQLRQPIRAPVKLGADDASVFGASLQSSQPCDWSLSVDALYDHCVGHYKRLGSMLCP